MKTIVNKILKRSKKVNGCIVWQGALTNGYGQVYDGKTKKVIYTHRAIYEELVCKIPEGLTIDHLCRNSACVNIKHMEIVTLGENVRRSRFGVHKSICKHGHKFNKKNTYIYGKTNGRGCRICKKIWMHNFYHRKDNV